DNTSAHLSNVEAKVDHIAIADDVLFPFDRHLAGFFALSFAAESEEVLPPNDFGFDESSLEVRVNHASSLGRRRAFQNSPSPALLLSGREVSDEPEKIISGANHRVQ